MTRPLLRAGRLAIVAIAPVLAHCGTRAGATAAADRVIVLKSQRQLALVRQGSVLKTYRVALGGTPTGPKARAGDERTPEGIYSLDWRNSESRFYRSIHISYPSTRDRERARELGVAPGGDIMIHGLPNGWRWLGPLHRAMDWTDGCIAVTNAEMDEIWRAVADGIPIEIKP